MKDALKKLLGLDESEQQQEHESGCIKRASAALMAEVMAVDHDWAEVEIDTIGRLMQQQMELSAQESSQILDAVLEEQKERHDLFQMTRLVNEKYSEAEKFELVKCLWRVAYADGNLDSWEEHIIRRIADLLHLPHRLFIQSKLQTRPQGSDDPQP